MPLRNGKPLTFRPKTVCDARDGTNGPPGGMFALTNLIPSPLDMDIWVPRPASIGLAALPGTASALLVIGNIAYGMAAGGLFPGYDQPFAYNLVTNAFLPITGINAGNVPVTQPTTGDWTPPIMALVGTRVIVTHPGFPGGSGPYFGWLDLSNLSETTTGNTNTSTLITGNPFILGLQPGLTIAGAGIPANTTIVSTANYVNDTTADTNSSTSLTSVANTAGIAFGQTVAGAGIPTGTTVVSVTGSTVVMSQAATATATGVSITFAGTTITLSQAATASANGVSLAIAGGSPSAPLWGAGNTNGNPLSAVPVSVAQMAGSAFYAVSNGVVISDPLLPVQVTNASQVLTFSNGLPVTALGPLPLNSLLGGIVQAIIAFQGITAMQQITGAFATSNLSVNVLPVPTGTLAPLSIVPTTEGLAFVSPEGLRIINFAANVGPPIGDAGSGVAFPFIYALYPSRICAAATADTLRITAQSSDLIDNPFYEYWYDFTRRVWSGPHTFPAAMIQPWANTFIMAAIASPARLWQSDAIPNGSLTFIENGQQMGFFYATSQLPDTGAMAENAVIESTIMLALPAAAQVSVGCTADDGTILDSVIIFGISAPSTIWGQFIWGQARWGTLGYAPLVQRQMNWSVPLVFKQAAFTVSGNCGPGVAIGNLYLRYQILGYLLERAS